MHILILATTAKDMTFEVKELLSQVSAVLRSAESSG
jgi:hypothetical protein